jgi:hypothetical protein
MTQWHLSMTGLPRAAWAALLAWSAVAGCGDVRLPGGPAIDAGTTRPDARPRPDAGPNVDAGPSSDANLGCVALDLGSAFGSPIHTGDTTDTPDRSQSCDGGDGYGDVFLLWTAPSTGQFRFDTCGSNVDFDTVLSAREDNCDGSQIDCNDDSTACGGDASVQSRLILDLVEGQRIILIVDGFDNEGAFQLNIEPR